MVCFCESILDFSLQITDFINIQSISVNHDTANNEISCVHGILKCHQSHTRDFTDNPSIKSRP